MINRLSSFELAARDKTLLDRRGLNSGEQAAFAELLTKAQNESPEARQARLKSLNSEEMELLRRAHSLAEPIQLQGLTLEGLYNLLQAPTAAQDLDGDGLENVGAAQKWTFPPPNASEGLRKAWDSSVEGQSLSDLQCQGLFLSLSLGTPTRQTDSMQEIVSRLLEGNEVSRPFNTVQHYMETKDFLTRFLENLRRFDVA